MKMTLNIKNRLLTIAVLCCISIATAQQEAQYTQYMYNTSLINPAYSGSEEVFKLSMLHRSQWVGIPGAPTTQTLSLEGMLARRLGASINLSKDVIGPLDEYTGDVNIAYHIQLTKKGRLALGLKGGIKKFRLDLTKGNLNDQQGMVTTSSVTSDTYTTMGAGLYYYTDRTYIGVSTPNLLESDYQNSDLNVNYNPEKHFFLIAGTVFDIGTYTRFKPAILAKAVSGAPLSLDVSANFMFRDKFILGAAYRLDAAISGLLGIHLSKNLFVGYAYDHTTTIDSRYTGGTHELFLRVKLSKNSPIYKSPRFF